MLKINPEWKKYNDFFNEGGEGYNPHKKYISAPENHGSAAAQTATPAATDRLVKDQRGNQIRESALRTILAKDMARLEKVTDPFAKNILEKSIAHAKSQLA